MALKQVIAAKRRQLLAEQLETFVKKRDELNERAKVIQTREEELEAAANEMTAETSAEDQAAFESVVKDFETEKAAHGEEVRENDTKIGELEHEIAGLDEELKGYAEEAERARKVPKDDPAPKPHAEVRKDETYMNKNKVLRFNNIAERDAFFARDDMKQFMQRARAMLRKDTSIENADLLIPTVALPMLRDQVESYSKLIRVVNLVNVNGKGRQPILGLPPEAVWTEQCADINKIGFGIGEIEVDGYKVAGYIPICNPILEDSDPDLADIIFDMLAKAIAKAVDKAIIYGKGQAGHMPTGIVTRLAQTSRPSDYDVKGLPWTDLHESNIVTISNTTGKDFYKSFILTGAKAKSRYVGGNRFWAMTETTKLSVIAEIMNYNAAGALVGGMNNTMPVIGGEIIELTDDVLPDNNILTGFGAGYTMAERAGTSLARSEHYRFVEDQTIFRGTARYDGKPVVGEAFALIGLGTAPTTSATFAPDIANASDGD